MSTLSPGTCRYCGCHGESCTLPNGDKCAWSDAGCMVCTAPGCMRAELTRVRSAGGKARSKYAGWGYGAILEDLRKERRRGRRRRKAA